MKKIRYSQFLLAIFALCCLVMIACNFEGKKAYDLQPQKKKLSIVAEMFDNFIFQIVTVTSSQSLNKPIVWAHNIGDTIGIGYDPALMQNFPILLDGGGTDGLLFDTVPNVKITLYEDDKILRDNFQPDFPQDIRGIYTARPYQNLRFLPDKTYKLVVSAPGFDTVVATQKAVRSSAKLRSFRLDLKSALSPSKKSKLDEFILEIDDNPNEENYYAVDIIARVKDSMVIGGQRIYPLLLFKTDINATSAQVISDRNFNGQRYSWRVGAPSSCDGCPTTEQELLIGFREVSKDYNDYRKQLEILNDASENPFAEPFKVSTNAKGGYGYFLISGTPDTLTRTVFR